MPEIGVMVSDTMSPPRGAVVVVTGALDTVSGADRSYESVAQVAQAAGVPVFVIGYGEAGVPRPEEGDFGGLWTVAEGTGGRYIPGVEALYAEHLVPAVVESIGRSYEVCVEAMVLSDGSDYAGVDHISRITVAVEAGGGEKARPGRPPSGSRRALGARSPSGRRSRS